jgi:molybdenum cofactor biosynthesis enzyme MoaA
MKPHPNNFCGGNFQDWLEVYLTNKCNGSCSWCVDKNGWSPKEKAPVAELAKAIIDAPQKKVILLGGEPTLYPDLKKLIQTISKEKEVYLTTNGGKLSPNYVKENLVGLTGLNVSIHSYWAAENEAITGIYLHLFHFSS